MDMGILLSRPRLYWGGAGGWHCFLILSKSLLYILSPIPIPHIVPPYVDNLKQDRLDVRQIK